MPQLHPNFNTKALEALVTPTVVNQAIDEVEEKVAAPEAASASGGEVTTSAGGLGIGSSK